MIQRMMERNEEMAKIIRTPTRGDGRDFSPATAEEAA